MSASAVCRRIVSDGANQTMNGHSLPWHSAITLTACAAMIVLPPPVGTLIATVGVSFAAASYLRRFPSRAIMSADEVTDS